MFDATDSAPERIELIVIDSSAKRKRTGSSVNGSMSALDMAKQLKQQRLEIASGQYKNTPMAIPSPKKPLKNQARVDNIKKINDKKMGSFDRHWKLLQIDNRIISVPKFDNLEKEDEYLKNHRRYGRVYSANKVTNKAQISASEVNIAITNHEIAENKSLDYDQQNVDKQEITIELQFPVGGDCKIKADFDQESVTVPEAKAANATDNPTTNETFDQFCEMNEEYFEIHSLELGGEVELGESLHCDSHHLSPIATNQSTDNGTDIHCWLQVRIAYCLK